MVKVIITIRIQRMTDIWCHFYLKQNNYKRDLFIFLITIEIQPNGRSGHFITMSSDF